MSKESSVDNLNEAIQAVVDTFKFHGVSITNMDISGYIPSFDVIVSKSQKIKSLEDTLDFVYWTLWTLIYGKYDKEKFFEKEIELNYKEVE